jgi:penicillin G amidase
MQEVPQMRDAIKRRTKGLLWIVVAGAFVLTAGWFYLRSSLPQYNGTITVTGLQHAVVIKRDQDGIPHLLVHDQKDAAFAMGYSHAQDRLWQMEMNRRIGQGRLSEILGKDALETDKFMRILGFYRQAEKTFSKLDSGTRDLLQAYADGFNSFLATRRGALPPEFLLLGVKPAPWKPADSLLWLKLMSLDLGYQWRTELARLTLSTQLSTQKLNQLLPPYPGESAIDLPDPKTLFPDLLPPPVNARETEGKGSNNWVVAGTRTVSGKPLLANDPHLNLTTPGIWYLVHVRMGKRNVVGVTMPGVPFVVLGRTDNVAWGFTNTGPDTQDLIVEKIIDPLKGTYLTPDGEKTFIRRIEIIKIRKAPDFRLVVRESRNGPILSDVFDKLQARMGTRYAMAIRWTALDENDPTASAGFRMNLSNSVEDVMANAKDFMSPQQNIVIADTEGTIGYLAAGRVPIRSSKNPTHGMMPTPGWRTESDWTGYIPYESLPHELNPMRGFIATANQKVVGRDYPFSITHDWEDPDRYDRIVELIEATPKHSINSFEKMQADIFSQYSADMRNAILPALQNDTAIPHDIVLALAAWDGRMVADKPEPLIMIAWQRAFVKRVTEDDLGPLFKDNWKLRSRFVHGILAGQLDAVQWCDNMRTELAESCASQEVRAMTDTLIELRHDYGPDWRKWRWGDAHQAVGQHRPFSMVPRLARYFETRRVIGGSTDTINVAHPRFAGDRPYDSDLLPSYRGIFDLSNLENSRFVIPNGQSGNPFSSHYRDFADRWAAVHYRTVPTTDAAIAVDTIDTLTLIPAKQ